jgi:hypothetical protein
MGNKIKSYTLKKLSNQKPPKSLIDNINHLQLTNANSLREIILANLPFPLSTLSMRIQIKIISYTTQLEYNEIWLPRCTTANTSSYSGIKWSTSKSRLNKHLIISNKTPTNPTDLLTSKKLLETYISTTLNQILLSHN